MNCLNEVPEQARPRFLRALKRLLREIVLLRFEQTALKTLDGKYSVGFDFFAIAQTAIYGDRLIRLVRLLEDDAEVASFWYLNRCAPRAVKKSLTRAGLTVDEVADLSSRLKKVRDKVFVHIDKEGLFNPQQIYEEADIRGSQIQRVIEALWYSVNDVYVEATGEKFEAPPDYDGNDIVRLNEFYRGGRTEHEEKSS